MNPLTGATVSAKVAAVFARTVTLVGLGLMVKSWTVTLKVTGWLNEPLVPVMVAT